MLIYCMRHGIAEERDHERWPDDGLSPDLVLTSPLARARATAAIVAATLNLPEEAVQETDALIPEAAETGIIGRISTESNDAEIFLVGHEPMLSHLVSRLLTGNRNAVSIEMRKSALLCLETRELPVSGRATLSFFLKPSMLRTLGES